jgi:hypothetical protein
MQVTIDLNIQHNRIMKLIMIFLTICIVLALSMYVRRIDGFSDAIPRFSKPVPIVPTRPHPATNSNGGLVHIS